MTIQTKHFVEPSDIVSMRFSCNECGTTLTIGLTEKLKGSIERCPSCLRPWAVLNGSSYEEVFRRFSDALYRLNQTLSGEPRTPLGFTLSLEIKGPLPE